LKKNEIFKLYDEWKISPSNCRGKVQKMGALYTHSPKMLSSSPNLSTQKRSKKKPKKLEKEGQPTICQIAGCGRQAIVGRRPTSSLLFCITTSFFSFFMPPFFHMWSTPPHWLQHMPTLPRVLIKFSNTYNF
jgi:hypothetical protein